MRINEIINSRKPQQRDELFFRIDPDRVKRLGSPGYLTNQEFANYQQDTSVRISTVNNLPDDPVAAPVPEFLKEGFKPCD